MYIDPSFVFVGLFCLLSDGIEHDARSVPSIMAQVCIEMDESEIHRSTVRSISLAQKNCTNINLQKYTWIRNGRTVR